MRQALERLFVVAVLTSALYGSYAIAGPTLRLAQQALDSFRKANAIDNARPAIVTKSDLLADKWFAGPPLEPASERGRAAIAVIVMPDCSYCNRTVEGLAATVGTTVHEKRPRLIVVILGASGSGALAEMERIRAACPLCEVRIPRDMKQYQAGTGIATAPTVSVLDGEKNVLAVVEGELSGENLSRLSAVIRAAVSRPAPGELRLSVREIRAAIPIISNTP